MRSNASIVADEIVYDGYVSLRRVGVLMPDDKVVERHIEDHGCSVAVLPYDPERRTALLVSMPRAPVIDRGEDDLIEVIAGAVHDEEPEACARREALEEAGVLLRDLRPVGRLWSMPTLSTERINFYISAYSDRDRIAEGGGLAEESESICVREVSLDMLGRMIDDGSFGDLKTAYLCQALRLAEPHLFENAGSRPTVIRR